MHGLDGERTMSWFKKPASAARRGNDDSGSERVEPALATPAAGIDPDWRERIDLAKRAYEEGKKLREGKPITFRMSRPLSLGKGLDD